MGRRRSVRLRIDRIVALGVIAVASTTFGASGGQAAGPAICTNPSTPPPATGPGSPSSCVKETLSPHTLTVGAAGVSTTRFENQRTSTATRFSIATRFSTSVTVTSITLVLNGSVVSSSACGPLSLTSTVSCSGFRNIPGVGSAALILRYTVGAVASIRVFGSVTYGGGNTPVNRQRSNVDVVSVVTATPNESGKPLQAGKCTDLIAGTDSVAGGDTTMSATAIYPATAEPFLPCTPAAAGVIQQSVQPIKTFIAFAEVPESLPSSFATVKIAFTPLPASTTLENLRLLEDTAGPPDFFATFITVPECDSSGLPPNPGLPAPGATDSEPHFNDSCIFSRSPLPNGGGELTVHVIGFNVDPSFGGG
jgi:hypothetical protein